VLTCRGASALGKPMGRGSSAHTPSGPTGNRSKHAGKAGSPSAPSPGALPPAAAPRLWRDRRDGDVGMVACEAVFKPAVRRAVNEYVGFGVWGGIKGEEEGTTTGRRQGRHHSMYAIRTGRERASGGGPRGAHHR